MPSTRAEALTEELARIHTYPHGGYPKLERAIAEYAGVRAGVWVAGAEVSDVRSGADDLLPAEQSDGELGELPGARPLVVDEAYFEYSGSSAVDLIEDGVIVIRTFSKAFGLAAGASATRWPGATSRRS